MTERLLYMTTAYKRLLRRPMWILVLLMYPVLGLLTMCLNSRPMEENLRIGVCIEYNGSAEENRILEMLHSRLNSQEILFADPLQIRNEVLRGKLTAAILVDAETAKAIQTCELDHSVTMLIPKDSNLAGVCMEKFYPSLYETASAVWAQEQIFDSVTAGELLEGLDCDIAEHRVFRAEYYDTDNDSIGQKIYNNNSYQNKMLPQRNVYAILSLIVTLLIVLELKKDEECRVCYTLPEAKRRRFRIAGISAMLTPPTVLQSVFLIAEKVTEGTGAGIFEIFLEIGVTFSYLILSILIYMILLKHFSLNLLPGIIPVIVISALLFTPAFADLGSVIPIAGWLKWLYPATWYLKCFGM